MKRFYKRIKIKKAAVAAAFFKKLICRSVYFSVTFTDLLRLSVALEPLAEAVVVFPFVSAEALPLLSWQEAAVAVLDEAQEDWAPALDWQQAGLAADEEEEAEVDVAVWAEARAKPPMQNADTKNSFFIFEYFTQINVNFPVFAGIPCIIFC
ncbi:MAG: hypothetical protein ACT6QS_15775 [Flavobacteriales bacterium]